MSIRNTFHYLNLNGIIAFYVIQMPEMCVDCPTGFLPHKYTGIKGMAMVLI